MYSSMGYIISLSTLNVNQNQLNLQQFEINRIVIKCIRTTNLRNKQTDNQSKIKPVAKHLWDDKLEGKYRCGRPVLNFKVHLMQIESYQIQIEMEDNAIKS